MCHKFQTDLKILLIIKKKVLHRQTGNQKIFFPSREQNILPTGWQIMQTLRTSSVIRTETKAALKAGSSVRARSSNAQRWSLGSKGIAANGDIYRDAIRNGLGERSDILAYVIIYDLTNKYMTFTFLLCYTFGASPCACAYQFWRKSVHYKWVRIAL